MREEKGQGGMMQAGSPYHMAVDQTWLDRWAEEYLELLGDRCTFT